MKSKSAGVFLRSCYIMLATPPIRAYLDAAGVVVEVAHAGFVDVELSVHLRITPLIAHIIIDVANLTIGTVPLTGFFQKVSPQGQLVSLWTLGFGAPLLLFSRLSQCDSTHISRSSHTQHASCLCHSCAGGDHVVHQ